MDAPAREPDGEHFTAAIARHQLALQTELKRSTSLPSAMFDASDPMLEARLCEATESIFRRLLDQDDHADDQKGGEVRLEAVDAEELQEVVRAACRGAFAIDTPPALTENADAEFKTLLAEICARSHGEAQHRAAQLLGGDRRVGPADLDALTRELADQLGRLGESNDGDALLRICRRLADTVLACSAPWPGSAGSASSTGGDAR